jgi:aspartyl-tRNA(Asn)/glutamyl-tRNA(Gln) amidotransferase subunit A
LFNDHRLDAIVVPTLPGTAAPADDTFLTYADGTRESVSFAYTRLCTVFNLTGQPALTINSGFDRHQLPIGLTIAGRPFDEARICRIGQAFEQARALHQQRPTLLGN